MFKKNKYKKIGFLVFILVLFIDVLIIRDFILTNKKITIEGFGALIFIHLAPIQMILVNKALYMFRKNELKITELEYHCNKKLIVVDIILTFLMALSGIIMLVGVLVR